MKNGDSAEIYPVIGHEGYGVDKEGNFYSYWINKGKNGVHLSEKPKKIKGSKSKKGYITFWIKGERKRPYAHRLVYETFKGKIPEGMVVRHLNDIPDDNRLENLTIGTQKENAEDYKRNGRSVVGEGRWNSIFNEKDIRNIRNMHENKRTTYVEIAKKYNCSPSTIKLIVKRVNWKHVI